MRELVGFGVGLGLAVLGVAIVVLVAWLGWLVADAFGSVVLVFGLSCFSTGAALTLGVRLLVERRLTRVRWVWSRRDLLVLAVWRVTAVPSSMGVLDAATAPCVVAAIAAAGHSRIVRGTLPIGEAVAGSPEVGEAPLS